MAYPRPGGGVAAVLVGLVLGAATLTGCVTAPVEDPRRERAEALTRVGSWGEAAGLWTDIYLVSGGRNFDAGLRAASALLEAERFVEARSLLTQLASRDDSKAETYELLGLAQEGAGQAQEAWTSYGKALDLDAQRPIARARRGAVSLLLGDAEGARADLIAARQSGDSGPTTWRNLGRAQIVLGDRDAAARAFDKAFAGPLADPIEEGIDQRLEAARALGADPRISAWLEPVIRARPGHGEALRRLGEAYIESGRFGRALGLLEEAASSDPGNIETLAAYARGLVLAGKPARARAVLEHARAVGPDAKESRLLEEIAESMRADEAASEPEDSSVPAGEPTVPDAPKGAGTASGGDS